MSLHLETKSDFPIDIVADEDAGIGMIELANPRDYPNEDVFKRLQFQGRVHGCHSIVGRSSVSSFLCLLMTRICGSRNILPELVL